MGKRSCRTTKSGRYINPTDQLRKEERRRELKKNKKQRETVRTAIIKAQEPKRVIEELEALDDVEYNPLQSSSLSSRVLQEKRHRLRRTLEKVRLLMEKDSPESVGEFRQMMTNYEKRRVQRQQYYEQVKNAERVKPDQIPLPSDMPPPSNPTFADSIPLPTKPVHGILKKAQGLMAGFAGVGAKVVFRLVKNLPAPPPGHPPDLSDSDDAQSDDERYASSESINSESPSDSSLSASESDENEAAVTESTSRPRKSLRFADDVASDPKDTRLTASKERQRGKGGVGEEDETPYDPEQPVESESSYYGQGGSAKANPTTAIPGFTPQFPPPLPPVLQQPRMQMPPYATQGYSNDMHPPGGNVRRLPGGKLVLAGGPTVFQAAPTTVQRGATSDASKQQRQMQLQQSQAVSSIHQMAPPPADPKVTTIEKKAQLKNLLQESTKFVPPQLKVRREYKDAHGRIVRQTAPRAASSGAPTAQRTASGMFSSAGAAAASSSAAVAAAKGADKDDIYAQFMKGLDGLL